ncbi:ribonuclease HI [Arthrobacter globiformis]|uniref:ribonuclease HI family protein n=1 Tax=Arthrobacter globiformis TaxID=1665 RepID=UPI0027883094|nr:ribonuclease HI family protein [Arthrobacter globiformis]MDQ1057162.1 ribonuclease HI [Arthrobacter globiformis]
MTITAAADGSALGNPGPAGWAWYVNDDCWRAGGWPHGTNNQGELMAVLDLFRSTAHLPDEDLHILCDSQYVINSVTKWMPGWKRKGWRKADGKPVLNMDILKDIDRELAGRKYRFEWVKGHAGHELNEAADERARAVALAYQQGVAARSGPGFPDAEPAAARRAVKEGRGEGGIPSLFEPEPPARGAAESAARGAAGTPVRSEAAKQDRFESGTPALFGDEPDLFSELGAGELGDEAFAEPPVGATPEEIVEALERELLRPDVRSDIGRTGQLLHPDFTEIGTAGRLWTRDAMMMSLEESPSGHVDLDVLSADRIGTDTVLLTYRSYSRAGSALRSSLWVLDGEQWRLRFHQGTPEA